MHPKRHRSQVQNYHKRPGRQLQAESREKVHVEGDEYSCRGYYGPRTIDGARKRIIQKEDCRSQSNDPRPRS